MEINLISEKLVNMKNHKYKLEPNVHFSPDGKWVIFRANFEGNTDVYAVECVECKLSVKIRGYEDINFVMIQCDANVQECDATKLELQSW